MSSIEAEQSYQATRSHDQGRAGRSLSGVTLYAGSLLIIGALTWLLTNVWESSANLFFLALAYVVVFGTVGTKLWFEGQAKYGIPQAVGGLFVCVAVWVAPVASFAAQRYLDQWPISRGFLMSLTLVVGGVLSFYNGIHFPFLTAPIACGLLGMLDLVRLVWPEPLSDEAAVINIASGFAMNVVAFIIDRRTQSAHQRQHQHRDFGYWFYLFGTACTFSGLFHLFFVSQSLLGPHNCGLGIASAIYMVAGALLSRQGLIVFGGLGVSAYLVYLTTVLFYDSWAYPFVLTAIGLAIISFGILVHKGSSAKWHSGPSLRQEESNDKEK